MPRPDRIFRTDAIILRRQDFLEYDRLLTIFTPEHGKLKVIAKGSRRIAGRQMGHVELYTRATMLVGRGRELHVVSQAELIEPFMPLREDLNRGAYATYLVELLDHFSEFEEMNKPLYDLLEAALDWLCEPQPDLQLISRYYELQLLRLVGFQPSLFRCSVGQEELEPQNQFFGALEGGVICPEHVIFSKGALHLSLNALKTMRYLQTREYEAVRNLRLNETLHAELERTLLNYIVHLLEIRLKSVDFIRRLRRLDHHQEQE
jgi:DNA repair protein RecO (recombination protein O)